MKRIAFFLLSLGLYIPALQCMENAEVETYEECANYAHNLARTQLIPGNHYQAANTQQARESAESTEVVSEGTNFLLALSCLIPVGVSAQVTNPNAVYISYGDKPFELSHQVKPKPQPAFNYVTTNQIDHNPSFLGFAYAQGIVAAPCDHVAQLNAMKRFADARAETSSDEDDIDSIFFESGSDN